MFECRDGKCDCCAQYVGRSYLESANFGKAFGVKDEEAKNNTTNQAKEGVGGLCQGVPLGAFPPRQNPPPSL